MKHNIKITALLLLLFLAAHFVGILIINKYLTAPLPLNIQKPKLNEQTSYIPIFLTILLATIIVFIMIHFRTIRLWKVWFFISVGLCMTISFASFLNEKVALILAFLLTGLKIFRPSVFIHNFTEVFIYGGLAAIFVPVFSIRSIIILLILISVYDMYAVWKSKHMIKIAKFQTKTKIFAGLSIPYADFPKTKAMHGQKKLRLPIKEAVLGGGDIGFTLLFSGVIVRFYGIIPAFLSSIITALALLALFLIAEKKKFYPAMPFLTMGCIVGLIIISFIF